MWTVAMGQAHGIDVKLTMEEAKKALAAGREQMIVAADSPKPDEEIKKLMKQVSALTWVGADPEKDPCGASALLKTKRYWLGHFGRIEARESRKQKREVPMPDDRIQKLIDMSYLESEFHICGGDEYFADGVKVALQQGGKNIDPIDTSPAQKGRKNEGPGPTYRSLFTARFAYDSFDPNAKAKFVITFPDGKLSEFEVDFSKIK
jgi:hypothetical protein